jgi:hypothetical protein
MIHHKRVKSDAVERKEEQELFQNNASNNNLVISQKNLPRKIKATSIHMHPNQDRSPNVSPIVDKNHPNHQS